MRTVWDILCVCVLGGGVRERERERERQTDRQTDRQTEVIACAESIDTGQTAQFARADLSRNFLLLDKSSRP